MSDGQNTEQKIKQDHIKKVRSGNYFAAAFFMLIGLFMIAVVFVKKYSFVTKYGLGAGFVPFVIAIGIIALSLLICWNTRKGAYDGDKDKMPDITGAKRVIILLGLCAFAALALKWLGMAVTIFLLYLLIVRLICEKTWISSLKAALVAAIVFYLIFSVGFSVKFPTGIFGF